MNSDPGEFWKALRLCGDRWRELTVRVLGGEALFVHVVLLAASTPFDLAAMAGTLGGRSQGFNLSRTISLSRSRCIRTLPFPIISHISSSFC